MVRATSSINYDLAEQGALDESRGEAVLRGSVAQLAVAVVAPAVEVARLGVGQDVRAAAVGEADNVLERKQQD